MNQLLPLVGYFDNPTPLIFAISYSYHSCLLYRSGLWEVCWAGGCLVLPNLLATLKRLCYWGGKDREFKVCPRTVFRDCTMASGSGSRWQLVCFCLVPITLCLQTFPQGWLASLASCHWLYCLFSDTPDMQYTLTVQSDLIWVWLGFFVVGTFFTKTHCTSCVLMQADFEDLRRLGILTCTTSLLLSKPQSHERVF